ncbi:MAG: SDR family oxidoreductase [Acidobacteria bacterium]|nr:SDR family oxidoreductase [Bryobacteraceae bacterium CoA2 C42]MCA2964151.1 SDR family oxidoreductase [Acidobacteriaceae bacterium]
MGSLRSMGYSVFGADAAPGAELYLDTTSEESWDRIAAELPRLDLLVLSAGVSHAGQLSDTSLDEWRRVQSVNLDGAFLGVRMALRKMSKGGLIVLIGSASGKRAVAGTGAYCASKAALRMLTRVAALEGKARGIRVNSVSPAGVATPTWRTTPFLQVARERMGSEEAAWATLGGTDPADAAPDRSTFATDVAQTVVFLCSRDAGGLTGTDLAADAGYMA